LIPYPNVREWTVDLNAPDQDGRVVWLMEEIKGFEVLTHRHEDIRRQRHGRYLPGAGRRLVQPDNDDDGAFENILGSERNELDTLHEADIRRIWRGLLIMAGQQFPTGDDVSVLLRLIRDMPGILEDASGGQWPINIIATLLSSKFPASPWNVRRVDNAKRRLTNWVKSLRQKNGLDDTELEALFAKVARRKETEEPSLDHPTNVLS
jgi:hypothetical protein